MAPGTLAAVALIGLAIGATLQAGRFGFAAAFRQVVNGGGAGAFGAQFLSIALASALMLPLIGSGTGQGIATPIGPAFLIGGVLFGLGMQLAGGCASGTLYLLGAGDLKFAFALAGFVLGSVVGAAHMGFWWSLPALAPITVFDAADWRIAAALQVSACLLIGAVLMRRALPPRRLIIAGLGLALLNTLTLVVAGRAWTETLGFALWGSKIAEVLGFQPSGWTFWQVLGETTLRRSIFAEVTSVMDMAIIAGAFLAALLGRAFVLRLPRPRDVLIALIAGVLMGYGARLSDGCNIGAYFSAASTGSLSGFVWLLPALAGSAMGIALRRKIENT